MKHIVREGIISSVNEAGHSARVIFEDADGLVSAELPVIVPFAGKNKVYALPDVGESVVVLMLENNGQSGGAGFILGSRYHAQLAPAVQDKDITRIDFSDNTFISYDRKAHEFRIEFADGSVIAHRADGSLLIKNKGDIIMNGRTVNING